jgi:hypothetical protein
MSDEQLITIREFAALFRRNLRACQRRAKAGQWEEAQLIAGRWYVIVSTRALIAARQSAA